MTTKIKIEDQQQQQDNPLNEIINTQSITTDTTLLPQFSTNTTITTTTTITNTNNTNNNNCISNNNSNDDDNNNTITSSNTTTVSALSSESILNDHVESSLITTTTTTTATAKITSSSSLSSPSLTLSSKKAVITTLYELPSEILIIIFGLLEEYDLCKLSITCHHFNKIASTNSLWMSLFKLRSFNRSPPIFKTSADIQFKLVMKDKYSAKENWRNGKYELTTLIGHSEPISSVLYNGESIISASYDKSIKIWDYSTAECKRTIQTNDVECMQLDYTNKNIITGTKSGQINVWDIENGENLLSEKGHLYFVSSLKGNHNSTLFCSGAKDKTIKIWDVVQKKMVSSITFPKPALLNIEWCEDQKNHIYVSGGNVLRLIDVETGQTVQNFEGHTNDIHCFSAVDGLIASSGIDATIKVWDKREMNCIKSIKVDATVYCLKFQPSHNIIVIGSNDNTVQSYRLDTGERGSIFKGHQSPISVLHLDKDRIISGSLDKNLFVWNCNTDLTDNDSLKVSKFHKLEHFGMIRCAYFDETKIISGSYDHIVRMWDFKNSSKKNYCQIM